MTKSNLLRLGRNRTEYTLLSKLFLCVIATTLGCESSESTTDANKAAIPATTTPDAATGNKGIGGSTSAMFSGGVTSGSPSVNTVGGSVSSGGAVSSSLPATASPVGIFSVVLTPANPDVNSKGIATLKGVVRTGAQPEPKSWKVAIEENSCKLLVPDIPNCSPRCQSGETCVQGGICLAAPIAKSAGIVSVSGVKLTTGSEAFTIEPTSSQVYMPDDDLVFPPFAEGAPIQLSGAGGDIPAFTIQANGIAPLSVTSRNVALADGEPISVLWEKPTVAGKSEVEVELDISQHAGTKGIVSCSVEDQGAVQISATLITELLRLGVAGFPTITVTRRAVDSASVMTGHIDLVQASSVELPVEIPGLTSCNDTTPCPDGKTCQSDYVCK